MHYAVNYTLDHQPAFDVVKRIAQKLKLTLNDTQLAFFIHMGLRHYSLDLSLQQPPPSYSLRVSVEQKDHIEQTIAQTTILIDTVSSKWDSLCSSRKNVQSCIQDVYDTTSKNDENYLSEQTALQIFTEYWYEISDMPLDKSVEIVLFENQPTANFLFLAKGHLAIRKGRRITKKMVNRPLKLDTQKWIDANLQLFHKLLCDCPKAEHNIQAALFILYTGYHPFLDAKMPVLARKNARTALFPFNFLGFRSIVCLRATQTNFPLFGRSMSLRRTDS